MSFLIRLYPACYSTMRHTSYKCWVSGCAHKFTLQKVDVGVGKMVEDNLDHQTQIYIFLRFCFLLDVS